MPVVLRKDLTARPVGRLVWRRLWATPRSCKSLEVDPFKLMHPQRHNGVPQLIHPGATMILSRFIRTTCFKVEMISPCQGRIHVPNSQEHLPAAERESHQFLWAANWLLWSDTFPLFEPAASTSLSSHPRLPNERKTMVGQRRSHKPRRPSSRRLVGEPCGGAALGKESATA